MKALSERGICCITSPYGCISSAQMAPSHQCTSYTLCFMCWRAFLAGVWVSGPPVLGEVIVILAARKTPWIMGYAQRGGKVRGSFFENLSDS